MRSFLNWFASFGVSQTGLAKLKVFCCTGKGEGSFPLELDDDNDDDDYDDVGSCTTAARRGEMVAGNAPVSAFSTDQVASPPHS